MSVTETLGALGSWSLTLDDNTPKSVLDKIQYFGHIMMDVGNSDSGFLNDGLLKTSRFVGQLRAKDFKGTSNTIGGAGMSIWMGDADKKGQVFETPLVLNAASFVAAMTAVIPTCLHVGTLFGTVAGTISTTFQFTDPRTAADYIASTLGGAWRVNGDGTVDAGLLSDLYRNTPVCALVRSGAGVDMRVRALPGSFDASSDVDDFTTRVLLLGQGDGGSVADGTADIAGGLNPYLDIFGNAVKLTRMVSESDTSSANATARAQLQLNRFTSTRDALTLSTSEYDIKGEVVVGDNIYVYDPTTGLIDNNNEVIFRGERLNPLILRCTELTWPVVSGMTVGYRDGHGVWTDLTPYVNWEAGSTTVVVGGYNRSLVSTTEAIGSRPLPDTSIPGIPTWTTPFIQAVYQSPVNGNTRAQVQLVWTKPNNTDGTTILDGDHYEIQWRQSTTPIFPSTWLQLEGLRWQDLETAQWQQPLVYPVSQWQMVAVGFDQIRVMLEELLPSHPYEARIRAVDAANPPNYGDWSTVTTWQTSDDTIAPQAPAPPSVAASLIAVQVTHTLGAATGGTYNLDPDMHHLEIHGQYEPTFTPSDTTLLGKLIANNSLLIGQIPAVGSFPISSTAPTYFKVIAVDNAGNKSQPSSAVSATAQLIDDAHISTLTASKITAGTVSADVLMGGRIATGLTGARVQLDSTGLHSFDSAGAPAVSINNDGTTSIIVNGNIKLPRGGKILDEVNNIIVSADNLTGVGLSSPFVDVAMHQNWPPTFPGGVSYPCIVASACTAETQLWLGEIPELVWPQIRFSLLLGRAGGSTSNPTYRYYINGTLVATYTNPAFANYQFSQIVLTPDGLALAFGLQGIQVSITVQASVSNTDLFAAGLAHVWMAGN